MPEATPKRSGPERTERPLFAGGRSLAFVVFATLLPPLPWPQPVAQGPVVGIETVAPPVAPPPIELLRPLADALRRRNLEAARRAADAVAAEQPDAATMTQLILAIGELELGEPAAALHTLLAVEQEVPGFDDLRIATMVRAATSSGDEERLADALARLLEHRPRTPRTQQLALAAAESAADRGDHRLAAELLSWWRTGASTPTPESERLALRLALRRADRETALAAGRWLLVEHPTHPAATGVAELLFPGSEQTPVAWDLPASGLLRRAERLLAERRADEAGAALAAVQPDQRGVDWAVLESRRLSTLDQPADGLDLLDAATPASGSELAKIAARRADLLLQQARQDGAGSAAQREALRYEARRQLLAAARWGGRSELALHSWRALYRELVRQGDEEGALTLLRALRRLAPDDRTGVEDLWSAGWTAYEGGADDQAVASFASLEELYPELAQARWAMYWRARALERLGATERARALLAEIAASPVGDFYRRHARARLGTHFDAASPTASTDLAPWPADPKLERVRTLLDLGLLSTAEEELDLLREGADWRATALLEGELLAARGQIRSSIGHLLRAFPELGTARQHRVPIRALELYYPLAHADAVASAARAQRLPIPLVLAMIRQESAFDTSAASRAGARGLMQLMPSTARELARKLRLRWQTDRLDDPGFSVQLGTAYFRQVLNTFDGDVELALAAYNCGPNRVRRWWRRHHDADRDRFIESFPLDETRSYVKRVLLLADSYEQLYPELSS